MQLFSFLLNKQSPKEYNSKERLEAAWRKYNAAFDAVKVAYGLEARTLAVAECQAATKELIAARNAAAGRKS